MAIMHCRRRFLLFGDSSECPSVVSAMIPSGSSFILPLSSLATVGDNNKRGVNFVHPFKLWDNYGATIRSLLCLVSIASSHRYDTQQSATGGIPIRHYCCYQQQQTKVCSVGFDRAI
eukprot:scaffold3014_cov116-Cylindrotheca_fusiformis.AAC.3